MFHRDHPRCVVPLLFLSLFAACGTGEESSAVRSSAPDVAKPRVDERPLVLFLGDSLTEGLGVLPEQAYPSLLERRIEAAGLEFGVVNAGLSGDTTAGGLSRVDWLFQRVPDVLVLALGANDGLRGISPDATEDNLRSIVTRFRDHRPGAPVVLCGMQMPPNLGREYTEAFRAVFPRLVKELDLTLVPFLLEGVGGERELNQGDGIHPNAAGHEVLAENVWTQLEPVLHSLAASSEAR